MTTEELNAINNPFADLAEQLGKPDAKLFVLAYEDEDGAHLFCDSNIEGTCEKLLEVCGLPLDSEYHDDFIDDPLAFLIRELNEHPDDINFDLEVYTSDQLIKIANQ